MLFRSSINNSGYANVTIGNLSAVAGTLSSTLTVAGATTLNSTLSVPSGTTTLGGATQINNTLGVTGVTSLTNTTQSTSTTTGALVVSGGIGVAKDVQTGGNVFVTAAFPTTGTGTGALQVTSGGAYISGNLWVGGNINFTPNAVNTIQGNSAQFFGNASGFGAQIGRAHV